VIYTYGTHSIDLLKPMKLYVNGTWLLVKPVMLYKDTLIVENVSDKLVTMTICSIDLEWHFTTADGKQLKNCKGNFAVVDKLKFILRSPKDYLDYFRKDAHEQLSRKIKNW